MLTLLAIRHPFYIVQPFPLIRSPFRRISIENYARLSEHRSILFNDFSPGPAHVVATCRQRVLTRRPASRSSRHDLGPSCPERASQRQRPHGDLQGFRSSNRRAYRLRVRYSKVPFVHKLRTYSYPLDDFHRPKHRNLSISFSISKT